MFDKLKEDYLFFFSRLLDEVLVKPDMLQIMLTSKCNLRCKMCGVWKQEFRGELTTDEIKDLIDQAIAFGIKMIYFTGGEALLRPDIFELIDYATRPGVIATVNTNGSIITKDLAEKIVSSKLQSIGISIDSPVAETHDFFRGSGVFEKAVAGIEYINDLRVKYGRDLSQHPDKRIYIALVSVIVKPNLGQLVEMARFAEKMQCSCLSLQPLISNENLLKTKECKSELWLDEDDVVRLGDVFKQLSVIKAENGDTGIRLDFMPEKTMQHYRRERQVNTCFAGYNRIFINPQGDISFVCFDAFANIKTDRLDKAWTSAKAFEARKKIRKCTAFCTQFCSEREESESIGIIHTKVAQLGETAIKAENEFLSEMAVVLRRKAESGDRDVLQALNEVEAIL